MERRHSNGRRGSVAGLIGKWTALFLSLLALACPVKSAYAGKVRVHEEAIRLASQAVSAKGFKLAEFDAPRVNRRPGPNGEVWEVTWEMKSATRRLLKAFVDSRTHRVEISPLGFFLYAWRAGDFKIDVPEELAAFVEPGTIPIELESNDLNGDGLADYLLVLGNDDGSKRAVLVLIRQADGTLKLEARNNAVASCMACGGTRPDAFDGIDAGYKTFTIHNSSGDAGTPTELRHDYKFNYSKRDATWELVLVEEDGARFSPPADFGLIKFSGFDGDYLGKGAR